MDLKQIQIGQDVPNEVNVVIEIPANSSPVKYEIDKDSSALFVDRFMSACMFYPCNYGFIPHTLAEDGDPTDVLVVTPVPLAHGCVIRVRPVGMLNMTDEAGRDTKIIAVPVDKLSPLYKNVKGYADLSPVLIDSIKHFFERYKELEPNKWVKVEEWGDADEAKEDILAAVKRYND